MKELERIELIGINGGYTKMPSWVRGGLWFGIASTIINHWEDIKSGVSDGWHDAMKEK